MFVGPGTTFLNDKYPMRNDADPLGPTIEDHVCVGGGVTLGPGVHIGRRSFIAAGCVVHKDVPENILAYGVVSDLCPIIWTRTIL